MAEFPSGTVTFLFTDLEGSTRLWEKYPEAMKPALARHDEMLRAAIEDHAGYVVKTTGDGFHAAFSAAHDALNAAVAGQLALRAERWEATGLLPVRMGIHTGPAELRDGDYYGTAVNRAARLMSAGHGGQIVVSLATEELVQESGVELLDLGEHVLRDLARPERVFQVVHPGLRSEFPRLSSLDAFPGNLPAQFTSFVGRDDDLAIIATLLDADRLVTVTGVGGVGKTRLAIQVAASVLPSFPDGTWLCELAAANDGDTMEQLVAATFGVQSREGMSIGEAVREYLRTKTLLVVFDNCEHLLEPVGRLAHAVLRACPHVRILATSRERLGVDGEHVRVLHALDLPEFSADASSIARADAARLFIDRARAVNPSLVLDTSTATAIGELCRHLDGIPLAIELAAAHVTAMSPAEIVAHLDERFRLLSGGRRSDIDRHQTLRTTVDWSYSLLTGAEQLVFTRLGTFPGTFDSAAAEAVAAGDGIEGWDVLDTLSGLVDKSMLVADAAAGASTRYRCSRPYVPMPASASTRPATPTLGDDATRSTTPRSPRSWDRACTASTSSPGGPGCASSSTTCAPRSTGRSIPPPPATPTSRSASSPPWPTNCPWTQQLMSASGRPRAIPRADETTPGRRTAILGAAAVQAMFLGDLETATTLARDAVRDGMPPDCPAPMTVPTAGRWSMRTAGSSRTRSACCGNRSPTSKRPAISSASAACTRPYRPWRISPATATPLVPPPKRPYAWPVRSAAPTPWRWPSSRWATRWPVAIPDEPSLRSRSASPSSKPVLAAGSFTAGRSTGSGDYEPAPVTRQARSKRCEPPLRYVRDSGNFNSFAGSLDGALPVLVQLDYPESVAVLAGITTQARSQPSAS